MSSILDWLKRIFTFRRSKPVKTVRVTKPKKMVKLKKRIKPKKKVKIRKIKRIKVKAPVKKIRPKRPRALKQKVGKTVKPKLKILIRLPKFGFAPKRPVKPIRPIKKRKIEPQVEKELIVADLMTKDPIVVKTNDSLSYVMRLFADKKISGAPVVRDENFVGVISESDIVKAIGKKELLDGDATDLKKLVEFKVEEYMHRNPVSTYQYSRLSSAIDLMNKHDITRLPVLDDKRKIIGIVTRNDALRGIAKELLYRILKKKPMKDRVRLRIDTDIDQVLKLVEKKGSIDIDEVKRILTLPEDKIEEWGKILERHGLLELFYPAVGRPKLRKVVK